MAENKIKSGHKQQSKEELLLMKSKNLEIFIHTRIYRITQT